MTKRSSFKSFKYKPYWLIQERHCEKGHSTDPLNCNGNQHTKIAATDRQKRWFRHSITWILFYLLLSVSVWRSSPRTTKRPRTGLDQTDLGPDRSPGPALVLNGPVLVLNFSGKLRTSPGPVRTGLLPLLIGVVTSHDQALNLVIIPLNPVTTLFN